MNNYSKIIMNMMKIKLNKKVLMIAKIQNIDMIEKIKNNKTKKE
jgi:hypothetical protein